MRVAFEFMLDIVASSQSGNFCVNFTFLIQRRIHSVFIDWLAHALLQIQTLFIPHEDL